MSFNRKESQLEVRGGESSVLSDTSCYRMTFDAEGNQQFCFCLNCQSIDLQAQDVGEPRLLYHAQLSEINKGNEASVQPSERGGDHELYPLQPPEIHITNMSSVPPAMQLYNQQKDVDSSMIGLARSESADTRPIPYTAPVTEAPIPSKPTPTNPRPIQDGLLSLAQQRYEKRVINGNSSERNPRLKTLSVQQCRSSDSSQKAPIGLPETHPSSLFMSQPNPEEQHATKVQEFNDINANSLEPTFDLISSFVPTTQLPSPPTSEPLVKHPHNLHKAEAQGGPPSRIKKSNKKSTSLQQATKLINKLDVALQSNTHLSTKFKFRSSELFRELRGMVHTESPSESTRLETPSEMSLIGSETGIYQCTMPHCSFTSPSPIDWKRHEESASHWPQRKYMCLPCTITVSNKLWTCNCCHTIFGTEQEAHSHILKTCDEARSRAKRYGRMDKLMNHLQNEHKEEVEREKVGQIAAKGEYKLKLPWPRYCGFCEVEFKGWDERAHHLVEEHFKKGANVSDWMHWPDYRIDGHNFYCHYYSGSRCAPAKEISWMTTLFGCLRIR